MLVFDHAKFMSDLLEFKEKKKLSLRSAGPLFGMTHSGFRWMLNGKANPSIVNFITFCNLSKRNPMEYFCEQQVEETPQSE